MDNSIIVGILETFARALWAVPAVILGIWLSTKSWGFYSFVVGGFAWMTYVISGPVYGIWVNPEVATSVRIATWAILPVFFIVLNIGAIMTVKAVREGQVE